MERSLSALKRLKTYSRNRTDQVRVSSLAVIFIETERRLKLKKANFSRLHLEMEKHVEMTFLKNTLTVVNQMVNKLLCMVHMFVNLTDDVIASPAMNLAARY